ncbi:putative zinc-binding dehydrogenase [Suhomyces tanzawaensis NRRL Y-17324]|uniref:Putative zinc-binding dehydrogenase n=1 Tax=Suhomyces tanzawaensis NRRL Y-17324 TaxID=984487 RepID=A0A1E4SRM1_9ASCO|nr:putative zinc-binding dehydrogenase [Suhomyces tanzawaensis NRRL Y-17324]ODV82148.1 putative zinc-binding dehydrogenase [Suhomyces tanzawaensis NRRL Y-17324]
MTILSPLTVAPGKADYLDYVNDSVIETKWLEEKFGAIAITEYDKPLIHHNLKDKPELKKDEVLIRNKVVGLNPIDWKSKKYRFAIYHFPWINGRESSGTIVQQGDKKSDLLGKNVFIASTSYRDNRTSTFQEYSVMNRNLVWELPESFTLENGATLGVGLVTAGVLITDSLGLSLQSSYGIEVFVIWGGSTVVGIYAAQLAKFLGFKVISISSLDTQSYLLNEIGVDKVVNRKKSFKDIKEDVYIYLKDLGLEGTGIKYAIDCVSKETSLQLIDLLIDSRNKSADKAEFVGVVAKPKDIESVKVRDLTIKKFHEDIEYGKKLVRETSKLLQDGKIKPVRHKLYSGGLEEIVIALNDLEVKGASAEKYVVKIV